MEDFAWGTPTSRTSREETSSREGAARRVGRKPRECGELETK